MYIHNADNFFDDEFKDLTQKMTDLSKKNCFCNVYIFYASITPLLQLNNALKFRAMILNYISKDPKNFIKFSLKTTEICFLRKPYKNETKRFHTFENSTIQ